MNYAFYITKRSKRLIHFLELNYKLDKIRLVVSDDKVDEETITAINEKNIKLIVFDRLASGNNNKERNINFSNFLNKILREYDIDYLFSLGEHILAGELLADYKNHIINFHPAILPMFPGLNAIDQAANSEKNVFLVGNTAHFVDEGVDTGKIIMQSIVPLDAFLLERDYNVVLDIIVEMLKQLITVIDEDRLTFKNGRPHIVGADYNRYSMFPKI